TDLGNPGPDYTFGWGLLNAQNAAKFLSNLATKSKKHLLAEDTFNGTDLNLGKISSHGGDIKATLIWTDPAPTTVPSRGVNDATIDDSTSVLVNDLDLWLEDSQGNKYYPWTLDPSNPSANAVKTKANRLDNIEQIVFNADSDGIGAGEYTVHVGGTLDPGYTAQDFSIFLTSVPKIGEGHCWGDVHHVTFDGKPYDLQSVGEFILVKSTVDDWQIQTRQEAWRDSTRVSINTAFATEMEGFNIVFDVDFVPNQRLRIDGINYTLTSGQSLDLGNSQIQRQGSEYTLIYAGLDGIIGTSDDDRVLARDRGNRIDIYVDPADYRATFLQGLLGNADGDISNDLALRDGTVLFDPNFQQIHGEYADSWRISQSESLFGTPTFADLNFPVSPISLQDFDEATRNAALQAARAAGIPEGFALEAAALDFAVTGDIDFIDGAAAIFAQSISLDLSPDRVSENETANLVYTFTRTGNLDSALTVNFSIGGTATANLDYSQSGASQFTETAGTITFAEGESTATLILDPIADTTPEGDENVILTLAAGTGYTIDTTAAVTGTLLNFNHPALIEGTATADLTEDADDPNLTATGNLTVTDLDTGEDQFNTTVTSAPDNLGTL
ncbi:MAG: VWD domain-containing protein, partial [Cyanobacteriota bacterium]|nr:VWD domain-containing protein [Cyanobacteriota bacterium]